MSLRTKGLVLIVLFSLVPLLLAGVGNFSVMKDAMIQSEIEKTNSQQYNRATNLASWMAIRKAEVFVISRTEVVRFGTDAERLRYFGRELVRGGFIYHAIGYIDEKGLGLRTDGARVNMRLEPFFQEAINGNVVITDPYTPSFSDTRQSLIIVPVYGESNELKGLVYASIAFSALKPFIAFGTEQSTALMFNDQGNLIYYSKAEQLPGAGLMDEEWGLSPIADKLLESEQGAASITIEGKRYSVFQMKIKETPWRFALQVPMSELQNEVKPIFWRIFTSIAFSELIIVIFFYLYFERIVKRLEGILGVTEQAAAGRFMAEHLEVEPHDEIGQLGHSVNGMMEHLQEMFDRLEAIINQNQYAFIVLDDQYKVTYMNKTAEGMLGYKSEELAGIATPLMFIDLDEIHLEAEKLSTQLGREVKPGLEVFKELRALNFSYEREWTFIHKDGTRIPTLHSTTGLRDRNGRFSGVVGMALDISDRKQIEKTRNRLLDIVESGKDLIASVSAEGKVVYINRAGREMLNLPDEIENELFVKEYFSQRMFSKLKKGAELAQQFGFWESGAQLLKSNGEVVYVSLVVVAHQYEDTGELYFSCIARDISEQKRIQEELVRAKQEAEEANQAKSSFLALMSHEIRTPLNGIIGLTQLMRKTGLSASQKDYMDKMTTSSETLLRLINDILDFSKIEAGKIEIEHLPFQPDELLHRISDQLSIFMGGKEQFEFIIATPENLPQTIIGDALRLEQILLNLCMNAIKFTNRGRVKLELDFVEETASQISLRFTILDTGIGMTVEQVDKLFKPFTQADGSTTRKFGGTGLGLVISKSLVELLGGKLAVSSVSLVGSQFFFTLPFSVIHKYPKQAWRVREDLREQPVWIVEDDDEMRGHWSDTIETYGLTAIPFHSWRMARDRLRRIGEGALPKLIILDMEMPDMYGAETWLEFHRDAEAVGVKTIAMTTSYGRDEMMQLSTEQRPVTLLIKPIMRTGMLRAIESVLEQKDPYSYEAENLEPAAAITKNESATRILLAEDNKINQLVAIELLKEQGYEVGLAENGEEALQKISEEHWDLILMDIHMPVMDGPEAVRLIRSQSKYDNIPIIAVTANVLRNDHERYLRQGMNDVVTKPVSSERLHAVIAYWLKQSSSFQVNSAVRHDSSEEGIRTEAAEPAPKTLMPSIAGMDVESAISRVNGKLPILQHMMEQFVLDYDSFADQLRMMVKQAELTIIKRMAHTLKGAAGYLSAYELLEAVCEMERVIKQPDVNMEELQEAITQVEASLTLLLDGLRQAKTVFDQNS
ncbi:response regulator [Paenibacillus sp. FSL H8-0548]|uniref:response regulator n=1 Tax=Paenibacillus sp. FSL H8-0548 TaxID=1920422 RepID=UPI0021161B42|nr:response regulator [Paenibacillus sp. FSL H8-0548]